MEHSFWRLIAGFMLIVPGILVVVVLPEIGIPLILFGTRLLGEKFKWAKVINGRVDEGWGNLKARIKKCFGKMDGIERFPRK